MENVLDGAPPLAPSDYVAQGSFDEMGLAEPLRRAIAERGYTTPTPVQLATFRPIRDGKDVIVRSKTGTGKTAAFAIPMLERIPDGRRKPSVLVMTPTRELAIQVAEELAALAKHRDLSVVTIYGGASMGDQLDKLKAGAEIIVGTPGRIYDHIRRKTLRLDEAMVCCLDEADEMLNMGFFEEVTRILDQLPDDVQQLLFSATVPADIEQIIKQYLHEPEAIMLSGDEYTVDNIHNVSYAAVDAYPKPRNLLYMIEMEEPDTAIVFCNTRSDTSLVAAVLNRNGYDAELLNGDLPQKERERVMAKVKKGEVRFMVATDIAARGIDISDLSHVINYSLPEDPGIFLHRVGRTGRIGKKGTSLSIVSGAEIHTLTALQKKYGVVFEERKLPTPEEARKRWTDRHVAQLKEGMNASIFEAFIPLAQELRHRPDGEFLTAFALKYYFTHHRMERALDREKAEHKREKRLGVEGAAPAADAPRLAEVGRPPQAPRHAEAARPAETSRETHGPRESREGREGRGRDRDRGGGRERPPEGRGGRAVRGLEGARAVRGVEGEGRGAERSERAGRTQNGERRREDAPTAPRVERTVTREVDAFSGGRREGSEAARPEEARAGVAAAAAWPEVGVTSVGSTAGERATFTTVGGGADEARPQRSRIFFSLGEQDGADETKVREAVASLAPGLELLVVELRRTHSFLEVSPEALDGAVLSLHGKDWSGRALTAEKARRRRR